MIFLNKDCLSYSADTLTMNTKNFFLLFTYHPITVLVHNVTVALINFMILSRQVISLAMADKMLTEVFLWLKSLSPSIKLEWLLPEFETRGFRSRRSLAYVQTEDLDLFFPSPTKLLLAERRILEAELNRIIAENNGQSTQHEPKRLNVLPSSSTAEELMRATSQPYLPEAATSSTGPINPIPQTFHSPLDRRAIELSENLKLLKVQVQSAKSPLQGKQKVLDD